MVATSQPLATRAGLRALERGGNAADAVLAAAAVLAVTEPMSTGLGGDAFALIWNGGEAVGLDAAGPAPAGAHPLEPAERGPRSVTVPGAVDGWAALSARFGRLGLDTCLADAIDAAERGFVVAPRTAAAWAAAAGKTSTSWAAAQVPPEFAPPPRAGERVRLLDLAVTLRAVAEGGRAGLYEGTVARAICGASWLEEEDLASYRSTWVDVLRVALPRSRGSRAPAAHAGCRRGRGARPARRDDAHAREPDRLRAPGGGGRARTRARRRGRERAARPGTPRATPAGPSCQGGRAGRRHGLPLRGRRRPDGRVVHPEPVRRLRIGDRGPGLPAWCCRTGRPASRSTGASSRAGARTTRSSPACSCATARSAGPSASWAATSRHRPTCSSCRLWWMTASIPRRRSTGRASSSTATSSASRRDCGTAPRSSSGWASGRCGNATCSRSAEVRGSCSHGDALFGGSDVRKDGYAAGF